MPPITWADVTALDATLAQIVPAQRDDLLALANTFVNVTMFDGEDGARTKLARIYIAAHFASLPGAGAQRPAGPVVSESRGGLSRQYASPGGADIPSDWGETAWGRRYYALVRTSRARFPTVA